MKFFSVAAMSLAFIGATIASPLDKRTATSDCEGYLTSASSKVKGYGSQIKSICAKNDCTKLAVITIQVLPICQKIKTATSECASQVNTWKAAHPHSASSAKASTVTAKQTVTQGTTKTVTVTSTLTAAASAATNTATCSITDTGDIPADFEDLVSEVVAALQPLLTFLQTVPLINTLLGPFISSIGADLNTIAEGLGFVVCGVLELVQSLLSSLTGGLTSLGFTGLLSTLGL